MRILAMMLGLVVVLASGGPPGGWVRAATTRVQLADALGTVPVAVPVNPDPRVGPIFVEGDTLHICTGSVVHSTTGDLILTAAHCLAKGFTETFVPGFANAAAPSNVWKIDAVYLDPLWVANEDPRVDYAFARVSRRDGGSGSIEAQVARGYSWVEHRLGVPRSSSSAMRAASEARQSAAKTGRGLPVVTPRFPARAWSKAPAARRG